MYACMYACVYVCRGENTVWPSWRLSCRYVCMHVYMCVCMYLYLCVTVWSMTILLTEVYVCMYCMYGFMFVCMYVFVKSRGHTQEGKKKTQGTHAMYHTHTHAYTLTHTTHTHIPCWQSLGDGFLYQHVPFVSHRSEAYRSPQAENEQAFEVQVLHVFVCVYLLFLLSFFWCAYVQWDNCKDVTNFMNWFPYTYFIHISARMHEYHSPEAEKFPA